MRSLLLPALLLTATAALPQSLPGVRPYWDDVFRSGKIKFNRNASKLLQHAIRERQPGVAVDLGMGEGRNAVFLAGRGWQVTGVDISGEAVKQAKARAVAAR